METVDIVNKGNFIFKVEYKYDRHSCFKMSHIFCFISDQISTTTVQYSGR